MRQQAFSRLFVLATYNSDAIESNTLTMRETNMILRDLTIERRPLKGHMEAVGLKVTFEFVSELTKNNVPISPPTS